MNTFWTRGQDTNADSENTTAARAQARGWRLTAVDRCDRCGAQAYVRVLLPGRLELLFCAHHNRQYALALADIAVEIQDETLRLACCALSALSRFIRVIPIPRPPIAASELRARDHQSLPDLGAPADRRRRRSGRRRLRVVSPGGS